jgi:hypothetical protein
MSRFDLVFDSFVARGSWDVLRLKVQQVQEFFEVLSNEQYENHSMNMDVLLST